ncbi:DeoR/GlpR family transcriptional regulator of sugar metabolism [Paenibacillus forsythiae]|uniref:DeoR/GlpR family transcriptional regulator of sugar metabolism n=1 Tax=Paenibacillus forsythiae TaxID=365616 RepID=A0ABU3HC82_9BACL|nr:DeoR/GlpR family DNA-binding transcription regulator [Paenibacillus forsythiae]MDT3428418.1 DeoR/GlpR family transcriptional regulator of sugar metabolism [Paenibacillus forsythiae]
MRREEFPIYQEERLLKILDHLKTRTQLSNADICGLLDISRDTARRDIIKLVEEGAAIRTHGGIALPFFKEEIKAYKDRANAASGQKLRIAQTALPYISEGDVCFMDVSTTVRELCSQVEKQLTVYTHSLDNAAVLAGKSGIDLHLLGGKFHHDNRFFYDEAGVLQLNDIYFDKAFLGAAAIMQDGIYFANREDALVKKLATGRSGKVYVLADTKKFSLTAAFKGIDFSGMDVLITDGDPPEHLRSVLRENGIEIILTGGEGQ